MGKNVKTCSYPLIINGFAWRGRRDLNPTPPSNISILAPKIMHTNAYEALDCIRNAYELIL